MIVNTGDFFSNKIHIVDKNCCFGQIYQFFSVRFLNFASAKSSGLALIMGT